MTEATCNRPVSPTTGHDFAAAPASACGPDTRQRFLDDGFARIDQAISDDELVKLKSIYDWCFSNDADGQVNRKALGGVDEQGRQALPQVLGPAEARPELRELAYYQRCRQIAADIFGQEVDQRSEHMILKPAGYGVATPWHQDQAYHDPSQFYRNINFWLPLDGATVEGGCMHFVPGSHLGPILPHEHLVPGDKQSAMVAQDQDYWSLNSVAVPCPVGSCSLHHSYALHYAGPNTTDLPRRAYVLVFGVAPVPAKRRWVLPWQSK
jgi:hypothetical protein